jgi:hypothetical protein
MLFGEWFFMLNSRRVVWRYAECDSMGGSYQQGWDDCLDAVLSILQKAKDVKEAAKKIESVQVLVKAKKFEQIRNELGVLGDLF